MDPIYFATFGVALLSSLLSGLAGGGGSFIMAPYWLISGMTPAQGATTGAFMALGMGTSSLAAYKGSDHMPRNKKLLLLLMALTLVASAVGPFFLQAIHAAAFKPVLALVTILSLPLLFIDRRRLTMLHGNRAGLVCMAALLLASSFITSSAFSILMTVVLMGSFGMTVRESTAVRRSIGLVQSVVIFVILWRLGNFLAPHAVAALLGGMIGSYMGTKYNLAKGETFARYALAGGAVLSALALVVM